jgi:hypothetical protein
MKGSVNFDTCVVNMNGMYCETVFPDGKKCTGTTTLNCPDQLRSATNMGYEHTEEGLSEMLCIHELAHNFVCKQMGKPYSYVHRVIATYGVHNLSEKQLRLCKQEEDIAGAFQTYYQSGRVTDGIYPLLSDTGKTLYKLCEDFSKIINK